MKLSSIITTAVALFAPAALALGDVYFTWDGSRIQIGEISEDETTITPGVRVFSGILGDPDQFTANDPGIMAVSGTFTPGTSTGFEFRKAVRAWDGSEFGSLPSGDMFHVYLGALQSDTPLTDVLTAGLTIPVDPDGMWHHHPFWQINADAAFGMYLVEVDAFNTATDLRSNPFWFIWDYEVDPNNPVNDVAAAETWVNQNLVPVPGTAAAAFIGLSVVAGRRRRPGCAPSRSELPT